LFFIDAPKSKSVFTITFKEEKNERTYQSAFSFSVGPFLEYRAITITALAAGKSESQGSLVLTNDARSLPTDQQDPCFGRKTYVNADAIKLEPLFRRFE
jgi:hypothetical protein